MKLNQKGYMLVEIIVASVIAFSVAYYLLNLTYKFKDKNEDVYYSTTMLADKINITKNTISIHHFSASWISEEARDEADKIAKILKNNLPVIAQIKKQYYLYSRQKNKENTNNFISYIVSKIRLKMKL